MAEPTLAPDQREHPLRQQVEFLTSLFQPVSGSSRSTWKRQRVLMRCITLIWVIHNEPGILAKDVQLLLGWRPKIIRQCLVVLRSTEVITAIPGARRATHYFLTPPTKTRWWRTAIEARINQNAAKMLGLVDQLERQESVRSQTDLIDHATENWQWKRTRTQATLYKLYALQSIERFQRNTNRKQCFYLVSKQLHLEVGPRKPFKTQADNTQAYQLAMLRLLFPEGIEAAEAKARLELRTGPPAIVPAGWVPFRTTAGIFAWSQATRQIYVELEASQFPVGRAD